MTRNYTIAFADDDNDNYDDRPVIQTEPCPTTTALLSEGFSFGEVLTALAEVHGFNPRASQDKPAPNKGHDATEWLGIDFAEL